MSERVCVCEGKIVCVCEREKECVCVCMRVDRESVCVYDKESTSKREM